LLATTHTPVERHQFPLLDIKLIRFVHRPFMMTMAAQSFALMLLL
jgi:hypothetical protein